MKKDIDEILNQWQIKEPVYNSKCLHKRNKSNIFKKISFSIAACIIIAIGCMYYSYENKTINADFIFDGSNSDIVCYAAIMEE